VGAEEAHQIFSCYVKNATEVNQIVAIVKYTTGKWEQIAAMANQLRSHLLLLLRHDSALEQLKKVRDAKKRQPVQVADVTYINNLETNLKKQ
jgi:hypothetical protein